MVNFIKDFLLSKTPPEPSLWYSVKLLLIVGLAYQLYLFIKGKINEVEAN